MKEIVLSRGHLVDHQSGEIKTYQIIVLDKSSKEEIISIQDRVVAKLPDKVSYEPLTLAEIDAVFDEEGYALGVLVSGRLVGFRVVTYNDEETLSMAEHLQLPAHKVVFFESTVILNRYQGNGLQWAMMRDALNYISDRHIFQYAVSTVAPQNIASLKNLLKAGFVTVSLEPLYGGKCRFICQKNLDEEMVLGDDTIRIQMNMPGTIQEKHRSGYKGTAMYLDGGHWGLELKK